MNGTDIFVEAAIRVEIGCDEDDKDELMRRYVQHLRTVLLFPQCNTLPELRMLAEGAYRLDSVQGYVGVQVGKMPYYLELFLVPLKSSRWPPTALTV